MLYWQNRASISYVPNTVFDTRNQRDALIAMTLSLTLLLYGSTQLSIPNLCHLMYIYAGTHLCYTAASSCIMRALGEALTVFIHFFIVSNLFIQSLATLPPSYCGQLGCDGAGLFAQGTFMNNDQKS